MSICNIRFGENEITILSDTMVYSDGKPVDLCLTKTERHQSVPLVWCGRGNVYLGNIVDNVLHNVATDIDQAVELVQYTIDRLSDAAWARVPDAGDSKVEITLAGWSFERNALRAVRVAAHGKGRHTIEEIGRGVHLWPAPRNTGILPATATDEQMIRLALAQWKISAQFDLGGCVGGVMHLTTVTRAGADQHLLALYPDYDKHANQFGDPNADDVAEFLSRRIAA